MRNLTLRLVALALLVGSAGLPLLTQVPAQQPPASPASSAPEASPAHPQADDSAVAPPPSNDDQKARAQALLEQSREKLISLKGIKARLVETVSIGDRRFKAVGSYLQGSDLKLRLELNIRLETMEANLVEVCDGGVLWTRRQVGTTEKITRRDVREILKVASESAFSEATMLEAELGLGGLPALLASIQKSMTFDKAESQEIDGRPFQVIEGGWNEAMQQKFAKSPGTAKRLPEHVPDRVRLYFDAQSLPRRIVYLKKRPKSDDLHSLVTLDFEDMVINPLISEGEFRFEPPDDIPREDITHRYIERLRAAAVLK